MKKAMTSKERVLKTFRFEKPDMIPVDFCADETVYNALVKDLGLNNTLELLEHFEIDFRWVRPKWIGAPLIDEKGCHRDYFGSVRVGDGYGYNVTPPLAHAKTIADVEAFPWPTCDMFDYSVIDEQCEKFGQYALFGGQWGGPFTQACDLVGTEKFLLMMHEDPRLAYRIMERIAEFFNSCSERQYEAAKGRFDIYFHGDDFGTQKGITVSLKMWREMVKPHIQGMWDLAKKNGLFVEIHTCGSIAALIPDMIQMGLNAVEPIQVRAADMDFESLVEKFGGKVVLHGSIDTQQTLPFGKPESVKAEVKSRCELFKKRGGFVLGASQHLMPEVPLKNIYAMYEAAKEYRGL